ncbi:MAG TPA: hypothetical protein VL096_08370, partial [Pirellulaceae bacterium]|nr:hypothetical protein [Pirellulaceae bacterium]
MPPRPLNTFSLVVAVALACQCVANLASAADPTFVGVLALAIEKDVADKIELSDEARTKLQDLVSARESAALELAIDLKGLEPAERNAKLALFVQESEKQGLALLTDAQKAKLEQVRIGRAGLLTLMEVEIAKQLALTAEQK